MENVGAQETHQIVTEFGAVNLKGLSSGERARRLIEFAHPQLRDELTAVGKKLSLLWFCAADGFPPFLITPPAGLLREPGRRPKQKSSRFRRLSR